MGSEMCIRDRGSSVHVYRLGRMGIGLCYLSRVQGGGGGGVHHWSLDSLLEVEREGEESCEHTSGSASFPAGPASLAVAAAWRRFGLACSGDSAMLGEKGDSLAWLLTKLGVEGDPQLSTMAVEVEPCLPAGSM